ncbi:MAG: phosphoribosylamine--glycine ligase [Cyclobacteriaceae bacterium]
MNILVVGAGGREHAIGWKLAQSPKCDDLYFAPGNAGTAALGTNLSIKVDDFEFLKAAILNNDIKMVVVGPEDPLVKGLIDFIDADPDIKHCMTIGPSKAGAMLEGSKDFSKDFMVRHGVPTAASRTIHKDNLDEGMRFLESLTAPYVLKADGLAAGKGVIITEDLSEAKDCLKEMILDQKFGDASTKVVIEEFLSGIELSVFVLTDGHNYKILPEAKDYKRIGEGDTGPNTGGMGAVSPVPFAHDGFLEKVEDKVVYNTLKGLEEDQIYYQGFIFIGLMNVNGEPYVIEYNVRMGDPETEVVMPRIKSDLVEMFEATATGQLDTIDLEIDERTATTVMLVSEGYPGSYEKGHEISGIEQVSESMVFHAGTKADNNRVLTNGGRVIACTGMGATMAEALKASYAAAEKIQWKGKNFRSDIGFDL